jgi:hypothetical protein
MKWGPPSLMTIRGVPKRGNITSWNILLACFELAVWHGVLLPIWTQSPQPPRCTHSSWTWGTALWNQSPTHQRVLLGDCSWEALHLASWCSPIFDISGVSWQTPLYFHTRWLEKATLLDLGICPECSIMSSIWWGMTSLHNLGSLIHRDTSS